MAVLWHTSGKLCANTGITPGHMPYFDSAGARKSWFESKATGVEFTEYSFIRGETSSKNGYNVGCIHIDEPYSSTIDCDYVMYENEDMYPGRTFYGLIIDREYVNTHSTRLYFDIDWYSSFADVLDFGTCLVAKTHIKRANDWSGDNPIFQYLAPEQYSPTVIRKFDPIRTNILKPEYEEPEVYFLNATTDKDGNSNTILGIHDRGNELIGYSEVYNDLDSLVSGMKEWEDNFWNITDHSNPNNIRNVWKVPLPLAMTSVPTPVTENKNINGFKRGTFGFNLKNAKCLMFPYCSIQAVSPAGESVLLKPQEFQKDDGTIDITVLGVGVPDPHYILQPIDKYGGESQFIKLPGFPQIGIPVDSFNTYMATHMAGDIVSGVIGLATAIAGLVILKTPAAIPVIGASIEGIGAGTTAIIGSGMITSGVTQAGTSVTSMMDSLSLADTTVGNDTPNSLHAMGKGHAYVYECTPTPQDIQGLDEYFEKFGYTIMRNKPLDSSAFKVRSKWTFIQTVDCSVRGPIPIEATSVIKNMLDTGCTFWNCASGVEIGDYTGDNSDA